MNVHVVNAFLMLAILFVFFKERKRVQRRARFLLTMGVAAACIMFTMVLLNSNFGGVRMNIIIWFSGVTALWGLIDQYAFVQLERLKEEGDLGEANLYQRIFFRNYIQVHRSDERQGTSRDVD